MKDATKANLKWGLVAVVFPMLVWGMDARIQQQMGDTVSVQFAVEQIEYLEHIKRDGHLTPQQQRDLDYWKERLKRIRGK